MIRRVSNFLQFTRERYLGAFYLSNARKKRSGDRRREEIGPYLSLITPPPAPRSHPDGLGLCITLDNAELNLRRTSTKKNPFERLHHLQAEGTQLVLHRDDLLSAIQPRPLSRLCSCASACLRRAHAHSP